MPLPILGALVVLGISGLVFLVHLMGGTKRPTYADEAEATAALLLDYPDADIRRTTLADDGRAALFELASGVGYAAPFGEGRLTRIFQAGDIRLVDDGQDGLTLHLTDYTAPRLSMKIAGADDRAVWQARLSNLGGAK